MARRSIMVVGSGFSGTLTALHLLAQGADAQIHLIEKGPKFGPGAAYGTAHPDHLLNVRAANMSAFPDRPDHFLDWLAGRLGETRTDPFSFVPRGLYGAYLQEQLRGAAQAGQAAGRLTLVHDAVTEITRTDGRLSVELAMGRRILADDIVLASGNPAPGPIAVVDEAARASGAYARDPWAAGVLDALQPKDRVLLIGSGLTMADVVVSLDGLGHLGPITAISRRGLVSHAHARVEGPAPADLARRGEPLSRALRRLRIRAAETGDWRLAFDGLRGETQDLWKTLPEAARRRFLRHLRSYWDSHRHRMAPPTAARIAAHLASGRLRVLAGRVERLESGAAGLSAVWRPRGERAGQILPIDRAINCTGPEGDPSRYDQPLIHSLLAQGLAQPDPLGLGLDVDEDGRLIGHGGASIAGLFAIGPIARGALWEVTAVPDIRVQARRLARRLLAANV